MSEISEFIVNKKNDLINAKNIVIKEETIEINGMDKDKADEEIEGFIEWGIDNLNKFLCAYKQNKRDQ